ncbi:ClpP crotonase [Chiua virens]|nr:ClpP crotonase [Chiua virens]
MGSKILVSVSQGIATITLNEPQRLNALSAEGVCAIPVACKCWGAQETSDYDCFANTLREIDQRDDVVATVWQANGKWFCAGTDVKVSNVVAPTIRDQLRARVISANTDCTRALYSHKKVLVAAVNGPVMGKPSFLGNFDFIYALPGTWLYVGFPFLGIVIEGGASVNFINRSKHATTRVLEMSPTIPTVGLAKANEGTHVQPEEDCPRAPRMWFHQPADSFHAAVREYILGELDGLDHSSVLAIKGLLKAGLAEKNNPDAVNLRESYAQAEKLATGIPTKRFQMISRKEIKHKL